MKKKKFFMLIKRINETKWEISRVLETKQEADLVLCFANKWTNIINQGTAFEFKIIEGYDNK